MSLSRIERVERVERACLLYRPVPCDAVHLPNGCGIRLNFDPQALRDLKRLSPDISRRIELKIQSTSNDMLGDVKRLVNFTPGYRLRVGDWRLLFQPQRQRLVVYRIVHRSQAYE